jgi:hypothetical protein
MCRPKESTSGRAIRVSVAANVKAFTLGAQSPDTLIIAAGCQTTKYLKNEHLVIGTGGWSIVVLVDKSWQLLTE